MSSKTADMLSHLGKAFGEVGLDLLQPVQVHVYNEAVDPSYRMPDFGRKDALLVLVANTKALWSHFVSAFEGNEKLLGESDPLDRWVEAQVDAVMAEVDVPHVVRYGHGSSDSPVAMQRLGHVSGFGFLGPSQLSIHRKFGPWVSYRAAIVLDIPFERTAVASIDTCDGCDRKPCLSALELAMGGEKKVTFEGVRSDWKDWLAIREVCTVGQEHRFSNEQAAYHYTHDKRWLHLKSQNER
jgi:hypothetical protein